MIQSRRDDPPTVSGDAPPGQGLSGAPRLQLRRLELSAEQLHRVLASNEIPQGLITICSRCHRARDREGQWHAVEARASHVAAICFSHGLCEACATELYGDIPGLDDLP